jgi:hypothetical protein
VLILEIFYYMDFINTEFFYKSLIYSMEEVTLLRFLVLTEVSEWSMRTNVKCR